MAKVVTLRLPDEVYKKFKTYAEQDNRPLSNYIETATLRYIEHSAEYVDDLEMNEISNNKDLLKELKKAASEAKSGKGKFVGKL